MILTSDQWTLNTARGYKLEFIGAPTQSRLPTAPHLNGDQLSLVENEITSLLEKQAIQEVCPHRTLFYSNLFLVEKKGGDNVQ